MTTVTQLNSTKNVKVLWTNVIDGKINTVNFSQDGTAVLVDGENGAYTWDAGTGASVYRSYGLTPFSYRPRKPLSGDLANKNVTREPIQNLVVGKEIFTKSVELSPDNTRVAYVRDTTGGRYKDLPSYLLTIADAITGKALINFAVTGGAFYREHLLVFAPNWATIALSGSNESPDLYLINSSTGNHVTVEKLHSPKTFGDADARRLDTSYDRPRFLVFSPDSRKLAVAEQDSTIQVLSVA